jgi:hypothetical protein
VCQLRDSGYWQTAVVMASGAAVTYDDERWAHSGAFAQAGVAEETLSRLSVRYLR